MKKTLFVVLAILFCASIAPLVGCDGTAKPDYTPIPKTDEYKLAMFEFPPALDPHYATSPAGIMNYQIYDGLLEAYLGNPWDMRPCLASEYTVSEDGMTFTFTLRSGIKFHNGDTLTVDDVVYSYERWKTAPNTAQTAAVVESVTAEGNKIIIKVSSVSPTMIQIIGTVAIVNKKIMSTFDPSTDPANTLEKIVGTGAYKCVEYVQSERIVLELNEDYHMIDLSRGGVQPDIKKVIWYYIPDATAAMIAFNEGEINSVASGQATEDDISEARAKEAEALENNLPPPIRVVKSPAAVRYIITFNMQDPLVGCHGPMYTEEQKQKARKIRQAIAHSIERDNINQIMFNGEAEPATQLCNPLTEGYLEDLEVPEENHELAKQILQEIGYVTEPSAGGEQLLIDFTYITDTWSTNFATAVQAQLQKSGILVNMHGLELNTYLQRTFYKWADFYDIDPNMEPTGESDKGYQVGYNAYTPIVSVPDTAFRSPFYYYSTWNPFGYYNPHVNQLIDEARTELNEEIRRAKLEEVNRIVTVEDMVYIPVLSGISVTLNNTYFYGYYGDWSYGLGKFYRMFWEDDGVWDDVEDGFPYLNGSLGTPEPTE